MMFTQKHFQVRDRVAEAREKFGRPFSHEKGSTWKPEALPFLTRYFQQQKRINRFE
jgi:hypothetical protein